MPNCTPLKSLNERDMHCDGDTSLISGRVTALHGHRSGVSWRCFAVYRLLLVIHAQDTDGRKLQMIKVHYKIKNLCKYGSRVLDADINVVLVLCESLLEHASELVDFCLESLF